MRRFVFVLMVLLIGCAASAEQLNLGTIKGMQMYESPIVTILKEAGFEATVTVFDQQAELMAAFGGGKLDGAFLLAQPLIQQIKGAIMISARLGNSDFSAVATDSSVKIATVGDLRKYKIGIIKGHPAHTAITRGMKVVEAANDVELFKMLAEGKFQAALSVNDLIMPMTKVAGISTYYVQTPPLLRTPTFLALSAAQGANKKKIEAAFKKWIDNGQWEKETAKFK